MNHDDRRYKRFALCREMLEVPGIMRLFDPQSAAPLAKLAEGAEGIMMTGEGSSRIFPAKRARVEALRTGKALIPVVEGALQAGEYDLSNYLVLGASNSGRTRELVGLCRRLKESGHRRIAAATSWSATPLEEAATATLVLGCGAEEAVAATKSVAEQAMVWQALLCVISDTVFPSAAAGADRTAEALTAAVPSSFSEAMAGARTIYFAGRNDGVAEELTLKTNEIVRRPADFLEGTYAAHGIEEIIREDDVVVLVDPFAEEEPKLKECLADGTGAAVFAIAARDTMFPTLKIPAEGPWKEYILLAGGWNLLVEAGIAAGVDLDKPERARKVGNEIPTQ